MSKYKHIFFDLDHTLWDFEKSSRQTLTEIYDFFPLTDKIASFDEFHNIYKPINEALWEAYRKGDITKETLRVKRFQDALSHFGYDDQNLAIEVSDFYIENSPRKKNLFPFVHEVLGYLQNNYQLHVITNGFEEVQFVKMTNCNLDGYFREIITSEQMGYRKPDKRIFEFSFRKAKATPNESIMIGDNLEADIEGARNAGMDQVYFNPNSITHSSSVTFEISCLSELKKIL